MFNHDKERGTPYCPMMKESCVEGWTKSMGEDSAGKRPKCAAWRPLPLMSSDAKEFKTVHACALFEWPPFLDFEISSKLYHTVASTDKVANEIKGLRDQPITIDLGDLLMKAPKLGLEHKNGA